MAQGRKTAGQVLGSVGLVLAAVTCGLPMWSRTVHIETCYWSSRPTVWEGLWMSCWIYETVQNRCYLNNPEEMSWGMQAARVMTTVSIILGVFAVVLSVTGRRCTKFFKDDQSKSKAFLLSGVFFTISGLLCCISVSSHAKSIMADSYDPMSSSIKKSEMGAALYVGWAATALLLVGGALLVWICPPKHGPGFACVTSASTFGGSLNDVAASEGTLSGEEHEENYKLI